MTGPDFEGADEFDGIGEDDGVLSPADSLVTDRLDADILDAGVDAPTSWAGATRYGTTLAEERQGEGMRRLLAQEEPDPPADDEWTDEDVPNDDGRVPFARSGRLVAPDEGAHSDDEADLFASDVGIDGGGASAEEAAVHITDDPDFRPESA